MNFNRHLGLEGLHAFLSPSKYHWINYDDNKLTLKYETYLASQMGTRLHELAKECIELKVKLPKSKKTLNMYVNDAIGYNMKPEVVLYFSEHCFGTADTIDFNKKQSKLRIHDLKTGTSKTSMSQLEVYTALFCLEYNISPPAIQTELRIYQNDEVLIHIPENESILHIMDKIIVFDKKLNKMKIGE